MMITLFFLFLILYTYLGYIFLILILGLLRNKKVKKAEIRPSVTLMIAAYNEEKSIEQKIQNSLNIDYPKELLSIVVVSDASSDETDNIVKSFSHKSVRLIRVEGRVGKTQARNIAMREISDDITVFSDATTHYKADAIKMLVQNFNDPEVGMATGHLKYKDQDNTQMGVGQKLYWKYETIIKKSQTSLGTLTGSIGCITAFRTKLYHELPPNIIEDFTSPLMFIQKGYRVVFEDRAICYEETTKKSSNEWHMRVRVIRGGIAGLIYAKRVLNPLKFPAASFQLLSHKVSRWMVPIYGILLFISSLYYSFTSTEDFFVILSLLQVFYYLCVLVAYLLEKRSINLKVLGIFYYFFIINLASLMAIIKSINSKLEATWETDR